MTRPTPSEPITIAEWWKNRRGESIRVQLSTWEGHTLIDIRSWHSTEGKLVPGKGFAADIKHLACLKAALIKAEAKAGDSMTSAPTRQRLPDRRASETFNLQCASLSYVATISRFDDGRIGEIFLTNHKAGSAADTAARDAAIVCSIALQFGADVGTIRRALCRDGSGKANGPLGAALDLCYVA
jgi:hypothetical protein